MKNVQINELVSQTMDEMLRLGLAVHTTWDAYGNSFLPILRLHEKHGKRHFSRELVTEFVQMAEGRFERSEIGLGYYRNLKRGAQRLTEMHDTGKLEWSGPKKTSSFLLNPYYERIIAHFVPNEDVSPKTKSDITWIARKYFSWLIQEGHSTLRKVGPDEIQRFMIYCSKHMSSGSVHNAKLYMKRLYRHLAANGYSKADYNALLTFPVSRERKIFPAIPQDEVLQIIEMLDLRTPKGKRDCAIILLCTVTGLRACDIIRLRLSDIDWKRGEIKIVQSKTDKSLALPLTRDVGEAIQDYILHGRQQTTSDAVFLRIHAPFQAFADAKSVGDMYDYYRKMAGLPRNAYDGKGFHGLRRSLGKNMVTSGVPVTMIAQVLGHEDINSTKQYISLDSEHLKECALDFTGIEPEGGRHDE